MRQYIPLIAVLLALIAAGCIAYIAWELSSDKSLESQAKNSNNNADDGETVPPESRDDQGP